MSKDHLVAAKILSLRCSKCNGSVVLECMGIPVSGNHFCTPFSALVEDQDQCTGPLRPCGAPKNAI